MPPKKTDAKYCPRCGSADIYFASGMPQMWSIWDCRNCGYRGGIIVDDEAIANKLAEDWSSGQKE